MPTRRAIIALAASLVGSSGSSAQELRSATLTGQPGNVSDWAPSLRLWEQASGDADRSRPVLYIHGFSFPCSTSVYWRLDGLSWADAINKAGFSVWGLDFAGYGESERYPAMRTASPEPGLPLGRADDAISQVLHAVEHIISASGAEKVTIVAHSWGGIIAATFAARYPNLVNRLVLFAPIVARDSNSIPAGLPQSVSEIGPWRFVTAKAQHDRFVAEVPPGLPPVLLTRHFEEWSRAYLATDPTSSGREPPSVRVPNGPLADLVDAWHGRVPYEPSKIVAPILIVRGEWDTWSTVEDADRLLHAVRSSVKRAVTIPQGTHVMLFEAARLELYAETNKFLAGNE